MRRDELIALGACLAGPYRIVPPEQAAGGQAGIFGGSGSGQSVDFHDFREYQPGDDLRRVDWRAYARTGQMQLKLFREEVSPAVEMILDTSGSMGAYPGKEQAAVFLAAFLRGVTAASEGRPALCLGGRRFTGGDIEPALAAAVFGGPFGSAAAPPPSASRPLRFYIGDCLFGEDAAPFFRAHAAGSLHFSPFLILSRSERHPPWRGHCRLFDAEVPERTLDVTVNDAALAAYRLRLEKHEEMLEREARRSGGRLLPADVPDGELTPDDCRAIVRTLAAERVVSVR